ncbi:hypothetical protein Igag_0029 [Ignisphaera aggregans DSM 17230]|uniref:Uncharacterized protein n=1 Tax=Ignisphaera aggregans (strain DSM 17230 / JCM 13409 / AQ1.S1) TaxID=583356 RepID=E0SPD9_IGNAA|nr:hypothetical protein Igag_0029 [Ignisphaera aggregans DSM 17230]
MELEQCKDHFLCIDSNCFNRFINTLIDIYKQNLYEYNNIVKKYGYYLKPIHIVTKRRGLNTKTYVYYGRYWYKLYSNGSRIKWIYIGLTKPLKELPDPPINPLTFITISLDQDLRTCICIDEKHRNVLRTLISSTINGEDNCINRVAKLLLYS